MEVVHDYKLIKQNISNPPPKRRVFYWASPNPSKGGAYGDPEFKTNA
jgi:hypothetical protein